MVPSSSDGGGGVSLPWYEAAEFADYSIVLDFENNRYALPALDGSSNPILTRVAGAFPKRVVSFAEAMQVTRYDLPGGGEFPNELWYTFDGSAWSLIGGDGLGINVPRLESWLGSQAMWVDAAQRFNRMLYSTTTSYPVSLTLARGFVPGYRVSWVGNDALVYSCPPYVGAPANGTIAARSSDPDGLNWGVIPQITPSYDPNNLTIINRAGNPGTFFHYVQTDTFGEYQPATSMIRTDSTTTPEDGGTPAQTHTERSCEHVRVSSAVASILGRGDNYPRAGTIILETHQTMEPWNSDTRRTLLGGNTDGGATYGRGYLNFIDDGDGTYSVQHDSPFGGLALALPSIETTRSRVRVGFAVNGNNNLRRLACTGAAGIASDTGNPGHATVFHFGTAIPESYTPGDHAGGTSGTGAYYRFMWSPDVFDATKLLAEVD
jgi:hypothetical protein